MFFEHDKQKITNQRTGDNIKRALSMEQGENGLLRWNVNRFDGGGYGQLDATSAIVSKSVVRKLRHITVACNAFLANIGLIIMPLPDSS